MYEYKIMFCVVIGFDATLEESFLAYTGSIKIRKEKITAIFLYFSLNL